MKIVIIALLIFPSAVYSQGLIVLSDSSALIFPNLVKVPLSKSNASGHKYFQIERKDFKALVLTTNHYLLQDSITVDNVELLLKNRTLVDSSFQLLEKKLEMEKERTILYHNSYEDLKQISSTYNQQLLKCTDDLRNMKKEKRRSNTRSFIAGMWVGGGLMMLIIASVSGGN